MAPNDPRHFDGSDIFDDKTVEAMSPIQLITYVHHSTRAPITSSVGFSQLLAEGTFGFVDSDQREAITRLQTTITAIARAQQSMTTWMAARVDSDGNWISDMHGTHPKDIQA